MRLATQACPANRSSRFSSHDLWGPWLYHHHHHHYHYHYHYHYHRPPNQLRIGVHRGGCAGDAERANPTAPWLLQPAIQQIANSIPSIPEDSHEPPLSIP